MLHFGNLHHASSLGQLSTRCRPEVRSSTRQNTAFPFFLIWTFPAFWSLAWLIIHIYAFPGNQSSKTPLISNLSTGLFFKRRARTGLSRRPLEPSSGGFILKMSVSFAIVIVTQSFRRLFNAVIWRPQFSVIIVGTKPKAWRDYWASEWMQSPARPWTQPASAILLVLVSRSLFCWSKNWLCLVADDDVLCPILYFLQSPILTVAFWILDAMEIVGMLKIVAAPLVALFMEPAWVAQ